MRSICHINFKKAVAAILLALLVFIHTEKAIHYHANTATKSNDKGLSITSETFICSICDYVFSKNADLSEQFVLDTPVYFFQKSFTPALFFFFNLGSTTIADRGPPSC